MTTLGDLLFAKTPEQSVSEREWTALVQERRVGKRGGPEVLVPRPGPKAVVVSNSASR